MLCLFINWIWNFGHATNKQRFRLECRPTVEAGAAHSTAPRSLLALGAASAQTNTTQLINSQQIFVLGERISGLDFVRSSSRSDLSQDLRHAHDCSEENTFDIHRGLLRPPSVRPSVRPAACLLSLSSFLPPYPVSLVLGVLAGARALSVKTLRRRRRRPSVRRPPASPVRTRPGERRTD